MQLGRASVLTSVLSCIQAELQAHTQCGKTFYHLGASYEWRKEKYRHRGILTSAKWVLI